MAPTLGYWNIRGLAQPIRLMLAYSEQDYEDKRYNYGPAPQFDRSEWFKVKHTLGLDFPNLPYYIDGDVKLTQSLVIMRYLARKFELDATTDEERLKADITEQEIVDLRTGLARMSYDPGFEKLKVEYLKTLPTKLEALSKFLGERKWFASNENLTYVDFMAYEALDQHKILSSETINGYQNLIDFLERFEALPEIQQYMLSPDFLKWPLNGDMAVFGSRSSKK